MGQKPRIARVRRMRGISRYSLASRLEISVGKLCLYELGYPVPASVLRSMALELQASADYLMGLRDSSLSGYNK